MLMRVDDIKIDVKIYHKPSTSYHSHDSSLYYIGMRLKDKVAVSVQATDAYQQVVQTASFCFTSDSIPVPRFNNEVQRVYFRARDTFRVFNKGQILVDTIRQFIAKQPNTFTDTLFLLDAGLEGGKVMSVFMSNNRFPRPSLRLEKSAIYDGEDIWEDTFYKSSGNYVVIYTIDKQKFSDYSYYGKIYSAFYARTTSDSIP